jgi:subtilisin family serine protease
MSFGLSGWDGEVHDDIQDAIKTSVLFAAASNGGGNGERTFPATYSGVFCIHASDGKGNDCGGINPSTESFSDSWTTLGVAIPFDDQSVCKSGTSYAAPIAAGTIANVFDHLKHLRDHDRLPSQKYCYLRSSGGGVWGYV